MITVTKPFFPSIEDYIKECKKIWENEWLTNRGKLVIELEEKLRHYLSIDNILILNNGTIPLQIALKILGNSGDIITTPFSYIATSSSILWENCNPVFVDIDEKFLTIDEKKIEEKITKDTTAILATHVFGNPCDVRAIELIAQKYNLSVIYDAAHCFGVKYLGESIFKYGDISTCSFHATKLFHTGEGGAIFSSNSELMQKVYYSHNFGHNGPDKFWGLGINGKISEIQAAMGLAVLPHIVEILEERKRIVEIYITQLNQKKLSILNIRPETDWNFSYFPIVFESEAKLIEVVEMLNSFGIYPRRYFYPSLNTIPFISGESCPISESISKRIICLPLYVGLLESEINQICEIINNSL